MGKKITKTVRTWVDFTAGENGAEEAGRYYFWCEYGEDEFGPWTCSGRALDSLPATDRFERMESERLVSGRPGDLHNSIDSRAVYEALWRRQKSMVGVRAATYREVASWMSTHRPDAIYAKPHWVCCGKAIFGLPPKEII